MQLNNIVSIENKKIIEQFFKLQNDQADLNDIQNLFAKNYQIHDISSLDVDKKDAVDIEKRIANFRHAFTKYRVIIKDIISERDKVFVWFEVCSGTKQLILNSMVIFTLINGKITRAM